MKRIRYSLTLFLIVLLLISPAGLRGADLGQVRLPAGQVAVSSSTVNQVIDDLEKWERAYIQMAFQNGAGEIVDATVYNWPTIGLGRLERFTGLDLYLKENEKYIGKNWNSILRKVTDLARISLAVGAAQGDPQNFGGKDLIKEIYNYPDIEAQGINGPVFSLIALDSGRYEVPDSAKWTREKILKIIVNSQLTDGGYSLTNMGKGDVDLTAMAIQSMAPYYLAGIPEVKTAVDRALTFLSQSQDQDGGFKSWGAKNSESVCQVIIALCSVGINIDTDPRFVKNANTMLSDLLTFRAADGGFKHILSGSSNNMASEQSLIALASYVRFGENKSSLYNYRPEKELPYLKADGSHPEGGTAHPENPGESPEKTAYPIVRIAGNDAYETAVAIAKESFPAGANTVILARGDVSADALPAVPLARKYQAPLLLTPGKELSETVLHEIQRLGAERVIIMGGEGAISPAVSDTLKRAGIQVERVYGQDHYGTAYEIAKLLGSGGQAVIVGGDYKNSFPDALSISAWAAYNGVPILYADKSGQLPEPTQKAIRELGIRQTLLIGGTAVLPAALEQVLPGAERYSGQDLYETNIAVLSRLQPNPEKIFVATGKGFGDALAGAAVAGRSNAWILLVANSGGDKGLASAQAELVRSAAPYVKECYALGGNAVVSPDTLTALKGVLGSLNR